MASKYVCIHTYIHVYTCFPPNWLRNVCKRKTRSRDSLLLYACMYVCMYVCMYKYICAYEFVWNKYVCDMCVRVSTWRKSETNSNIGRTRLVERHEKQTINCSPKTYAYLGDVLPTHLVTYECNVWSSVQLWRSIYMYISLSIYTCMCHVHIHSHTHATRGVESPMT
jgi:hypothetical protein